MSQVLIINGHQFYPFSKGRLNATLVDQAVKLLEAKGHSTRVVTMADELNVEEQLAHHQWADVVILQSPVNWMGVSWSFKKYMDEVYSAGMAGALCVGDGRTADEPRKNYGRGGVLTGKRYMLSLTFNAPEEAFNDPAEFFSGRSVDDLMFPMHMNFKFFDMQPMPTFCCFDVMKNPQISEDLERFTQHIKQHF
jgi:modulator of drug activity B